MVDGLCRLGGFGERQEHFSTSVLLVWGNKLSWRRAEVRKGTEARQETLRSAGTDLQDLGKERDSSGPPLASLRKTAAFCMSPVVIYSCMAPIPISELAALRQWGVCHTRDFLLVCHLLHTI